MNAFVSIHIPELYTSTMMMLNIGADLYYWQIVINHVILDAICSLADVYPMFPLLTSLQYATYVQWMANISYRKGTPLSASVEKTVLFLFHVWFCYPAITYVMHYSSHHYFISYYTA